MLFMRAPFLPFVGAENLPPITVGCGEGFPSCNYAINSWQNGGHMSLSSKIVESVQNLSKQCLEHSYKITTAESCTGGGVANAIVSQAGSSHWFEGGIVSYSNEAKTQWLQVPELLIKEEGAVSEAVARAMVNGVLAKSNATHAVAITGIAGPGGGTEAKPVGLVWFAWSDRHEHIMTQRAIFQGDRTSIRGQAIVAALIGFNKIFPQT
jgi:nicotinamide-nucleotide amidase